MSDNTLRIGIAICAVTIVAIYAYSQLRSDREWREARERIVQTVAHE